MSMYIPRHWSKGYAIITPQSLLPVPKLIAHQQLASTFGDQASGSEHQLQLAFAESSTLPLPSILPISASVVTAGNQQPHPISSLALPVHIIKAMTLKLPLYTNRCTCGCANGHADTLECNDISMLSEHLKLCMFCTFYTLAQYYSNSYMCSNPNWQHFHCWCSYNTINCRFAHRVLHFSS